MSVLDQYRSRRTRENNNAVKEQQKVADLSKKIVDTQKRLQRANTPSTIRRLSDQVQSLSTQQAKAEDARARYQRKVADLDDRIRRGEKSESDAEARRQKRLDREREQSQKALERNVATATLAVDQLHGRLSKVEEQLLSNVRDAIAADRVDHEYDLFLCHSDADKDGAVSEFYDALINQGITVFFDKEHVSLGYSLFRQLNTGNARSRAGVGLITESFLKGGYWAEMEVGSFLSTQRRFIPVLHKVIRADLKRYSPFLADLGGLSTDGKSFDDIAELIADTIGKAKAA